MTRILVLFYSSYGHTEMMAEAIAQGVMASDAEADVRRVPELVPADVAAKQGYKNSDRHPVAQPAALAEYDGIVIGSPTRFGLMAAQMKSFLDQTGALWTEGRLVGKVGAAFTSTATQHGGQEATILSTHLFMLHQGMIVVGLPYAFKGLMRMDQITGGSPYGASTIAGGDNGRQPSANELEGARFLGRHVAEVAARQRMPLPPAVRRAT